MESRKLVCVESCNVIKSETFLLHRIICKLLSKVGSNILNWMSQSLIGHGIEG
jgi:hypothetical protein